MKDILRVFDKFLPFNTKQLRSRKKEKGCLNLLLTSIYAHVQQAIQVILISMVRFRISYQFKRNLEKKCDIWFQMYDQIENALFSALYTVVVLVFQRGRIWLQKKSFHRQRTEWSQWEKLIEKLEFEKSLFGQPRSLSTFIARALTLVGNDLSHLPS